MITREGGHIALGFALGVFSVLLAGVSFNFLGLTPDWNSPLFGAIIGAILGGGVAIFGQLLTIFEARASIEQNEKKISIRLLFSLFQSVSDVGSSLKALKLHLDEGRSDANENGIASAIATIPLATKISKIYIDKDAKTNLLTLDFAELYNEVAVLDQRHNAHVDVIEKFEVEQEKLMKLIKLLPSKNKIKIVFSEENAPEVHGRILVLDRQLQDLYGHLLLDIESVDRIVSSLVSKINEISGKKLSFTPKFPSDKIK